jgi:hypothetical protein
MSPIRFHQLLRLMSVLYSFSHHLGQQKLQIANERRS